MISRSESDRGPVPGAGHETESGHAGDSGPDSQNATQGARLSDDLRVALEQGGEFDVLIEVTSPEAIQVVFDKIGAGDGIGIGAEAFEDAFPAPYVVARLSAAQIEAVARLEGVVRIEQNVVITAESAIEKEKADER